MAQLTEEQELQQNSIKIILVGDGGVGKTTYITRIRDGYFKRNYEATVGAEVYYVPFYFTNGQSVIFQVWDTAGQEINGHLNNVYYMDAKGAICMFEVTSRSTFGNVQNWLRNVRRVTSMNNVHIPTVICGNKVDIKDRKVKASTLKRALPTDITAYYDISARCNFNFEKPFLELARAIFNDNSLQFVANLQLKPADINLDVNTLLSNSENMESIMAARDADIQDDDF